MKSSLSWIKQYVPDLDVTAQEYADAMTLSGTKVEEYQDLADGLDKIVNRMLPRELWSLSSLTVGVWPADTMEKPVFQAALRLKQENCAAWNRPA